MEGAYDLRNKNLFFIVTILNQIGWGFLQDANRVIHNFESYWCWKSICNWGDNWYMYKEAVTLYASLRSLGFQKRLIYCKLNAISILETLFYIVEARIKKMLELWCLCCIMMFRTVNKQPGNKKCWHLCCYYQDIYDWIWVWSVRNGRTFSKMSKFELGLWKING